MPPESKPANWRGWAIGLLVALVVVVALQNAQQVSVDVLFAHFDAPLIVILLVSVLVGALIGYAAPVLLRHRRRERAAAAGETDRHRSLEGK